VNLEGFSSTNGFDFEFEFFFWFEALRIVRDVEAGIERRVRHIALLCGSKNRGIEVVGGIEYSERLQEGALWCSTSPIRPSKSCTATSTCKTAHCKLVP